MGDFPYVINSLCNLRCTLNHLGLFLFFSVQSNMARMRHLLWLIGLIGVSAGKVMGFVPNAALHLRRVSCAANNMMGQNALNPGGSSRLAAKRIMRAEGPKRDVSGASVQQAIGSSEGRLGAELDGLVQQARENVKLQGGTGTEKDKVGAQKGSPTPRLQLPGFELASFGFSGRWKEAGVSFMLYPPYGVTPKAVVHFLGGAFVGAAPHISYRYMLEDLADQGYIIVATPFNLIFNYVDLCAGIVRDSRDAMSLIPSDLPVLGLGHSCGALMHTLLPILFPEESPRLANVMVSWNNKPAEEAIPQFEELVIPFVKTLLGENNVAKDIRDNIRRSIKEADERANEFAASQFAPLAVEAELLPLTRQGLKVVEQLPDLLEKVNAGEREFIPDADECAELLRCAYPVASSLLISFEDDSLDESDAVEALLRVAVGGAGVDRVKRVRLKGTHVTPLTQDVFISTPFDSFDPLLPLRRLARQELLRPVDALNKKIVSFFDGLLNKPGGS